MPFFYSQYLVKDEKKDKKTSSRSNPATNKSNATNNNIPPKRAAGRLVWHSNIGSSGARTKGGGFKPLQFNYGAATNGNGKKVVHFATKEVNYFSFDWNLADQVFYTRKELAAMGQGRFDDAATLRAQRAAAEEERGGGGGGEGGILGERHTVDDVAISKKSKEKDIAALLNTALDDPDLDETVSIRGIEHFVYPDLQQEMIRRKKELQREVLEFARSPRPDPQGWRLAEHSRFFSLWARTVAVEKGMKYYINNAASDPEVGTISRDELERIQRSGDELESTSSRMRRGSSILSLVMSQSYEGEPTSLSALHGGGFAEGGDGAGSSSRHILKRSSSDSLESAPTIDAEEDDEDRPSVFQQIAMSGVTSSSESGEPNKYDHQNSQPAGSATGED
ncbi:hypothetical protein ACHAXH_008667 [Discostella pseudostelligera]